jgi:site-specific DNA-methyltransferase (adenine-specific)
MRDVCTGAVAAERGGKIERMTYQLFHGDCLEYMKTLPAGSVDAVITDPPYCSGGYLEAQKNTKAQGLRGATVAADGFEWFSADNMSTSGLVFLLRNMMVECRRILKPNRSVLMFTDWRMVPPLAPALESSGLRYRNMIIWDKGNAGLGVGFKPAYEVILEFTNGSTEYQELNGQNIIKVPRVHSSKKEHGAQKPIDLLSKLISVTTAQNSTVLDPFMGSGTTGVACMKSNRNFIGCELDPKYYSVAQKRIAEAEAAKQPPLL